MEPGVVLVLELEVVLGLELEMAWGQELALGEGWLRGWVFCGLLVAGLGMGGVDSYCCSGDNARFEHPLH